MARPSRNRCSQCTKMTLDVPRTLWTATSNNHLLTITKRGITDMARPAIHPDEILAGEIDMLHLSAAEVARALAVPPNRISQILAGRRAIIAIRHYGSGAGLAPGMDGLWLNLQKNYELRLAEEQYGEAIAQQVQPRTEDVETSTM
ncbi:MAG: addiction module antidote protein, HigA family [Chloroflexi bacterium AL-W]|nr:addiction module antidote protein, HigA family [Chloroflexi bacterium AL-N1]NOK65572.1 addiction module antidote protein, HigA family [Chloroflexi bacterium AL-N10]NOK74487.1 addiction module antidote protein, HigA family [Chloroflexi bacterium AL-N5]NOK80605.1 addiction module antidote protein, HigA family [Chloroflexi bacterium AL-W]NOK88745.1 addiction module antidote protein, HigA family [Chloroflexi bacterium AL-N15]